MLRDARALLWGGLVLAGCPAAAPSVAEPSTHVVAPGGDDRGPGTAERPWATLEHAARRAGPGDRVLIRGGTYSLRTAIRPRRSGTEGAWIVYAAYPGESVVLDASSIEVPPPRGGPPFPHDQGAIQLEDVAYLRIQGITVRDSRMAGFTLRRAEHVELRGNATESTFGSGIAVWGSRHVRIEGNTVVGANLREAGPSWFPARAVPPHEAITVASTEHFEVAHNHVHDGGKEGIDVKEASRHGSVHGNHVHHMARQGLYVDGWFAPLRHVELAHNEVHDCEGAGVVLSVENGPAVEDVQVHHNRIHDNLGTGLYFSRWGDGPRRRIAIEHNEIRHNGHGPPEEGERYYWITGGIYLYSGNLEDVVIRDNVLVDNRGFQIGVGRPLRGELEPAAALAQRRITVEHNVVDVGADDPAPVRVGSTPEDRDEVIPIRGTDAIVGGS